ncbi:MAG: hypothetical protein QM692_13395 [Thermomicrobiales bacterium]
MDSRRFDRLSRTLAHPESRRSLMHALAGLSLASIPALHATSGAAKRRQRDRVDAETFNHRKVKYCLNGKTVKRYRRKQDTLLARGATRGACGACVPNSDAITCAGQCGAVRNNCGATVNCGSCVCDPDCPVCQTCDATTGNCIADTAQEGDSCGEGRFCVNGACLCNTPPNFCQFVGIECGPTSNGCGDPIDCGPCPQGGTCSPQGLCIFPT